jgi:hypothetical protein
MMMIIVAQALIVILIATSHLSAMWLLSGTPEFNQHAAEQKKWNYYELSTHLYSVVDNVKDYKTFSATPVCKWIDKNVFLDFNIVILYFYVRNYLEKEGPKMWVENLYHTRVFDLYLEAILVCLYRVAYDALHHYAQLQDSTVFKSYSIFKEKFHHLLTYIPNFSLDKLKDFPERNSAALWRLNKESFFEKEYSPKWLKTFSWVMYIPGCYGISFGKENENDPTVHIGAYKENTPIIFEALKTVHAECLSWQAFFSSYDFPFTKKRISEIFGLVG